MSKVKPLVFRSLDDEHEAYEPLWMAAEAQQVAQAPFLRVDGATLFEPVREPEPQAVPESFEPDEPPPHVHRNSVFPTAPQEHAPIAEGGMRPSVIALSPVPGTVRPAPLSEADELKIAEEKRAFAEALLELATLRARALREAEQGLTDLAVRVAQAILERELDSDPAAHLALVRAALGAFGDAERSRLRASKRTYDAIVEVKGTSEIEYEGVRVEVMLDPTLEGLGCVVEGEVNQVDGRVEERLAAVWRAFRAENQRAAGEQAR